MLIRELFEDKEFDKELQFVKRTNDKHEIDYDLVEDLSFFMDHDDDNYRRNVYPAVSDCLDKIKANRKVNPLMFKKAVEESYKNYVTQFPLRELPDQLDEKICVETCRKLHNDLRKHYEDGKYKD